MAWIYTVHFRARFTVEPLFIYTTFTWWATCVAKDALWLTDWLKCSCESAPNSRSDHYPTFRFAQANVGKVPCPRTQRQRLRWDADATYTLKSSWWTDAAVSDSTRPASRWQTDWYRHWSYLDLGFSKSTSAEAPCNIQQSLSRFSSLTVMKHSWGRKGRRTDMGHRTGRVALCVFFRHSASYCLILHSPAILSALHSFWRLGSKSRPGMIQGDTLHCLLWCK